MINKWLICLVFMFLLSAWTCETEEDVYIYKVEMWEIDSIGECECHIRLDDVAKGEDSITCFSSVGNDTLHYIVNY